MRLRAAVAALFVAVVSVPRVVNAAEVAAERWHATVVPPQPGLPVVEIDLGYPGLYVPAANAPADFRARTSEQPFDGYIGYHIASGAQKTGDTPVVARAVLGPHGQWTFSTPMHLFLGMAAWNESHFRRRELVIEWRDRERNVIAKRSAGVPPWLLATRVLRIVRSHADPASVSSFGEKTVRIDAASLSDSPQWYAGFSSVVIATDFWFELPKPVRAAIFRSAIDVVFVGIPQRMPPMQALDRALLPIELRAEPGVVQVPWPYHDGQPRALPAALSWRAKSGADVVGSPTSPYFVANGVAAFAAEERALQDPLPTFDVVVPVGSWADGSRAELPTIAEIFRDYRPALALVLFAMLSIAAWLVIRRRPRLTILGMCVAVTLLAIGWRDAIRPAAEQHTYERVTMVAPGVVDIVTMGHDSRHTPRALAPAEIVEARMSRVIRGAIQRTGDDVEVRAPGTPAGFGELHRPGRPWVATSRVTRRRELGTPAAIRVRSAEAKRLLVEYDSTMPLNYIAAEWIADGIRYYGETHVRSRRGVATIHASQRYGTRLYFWAWMQDTWQSDARREHVPIGLMHVGRDRTVVVWHMDERPSSPARYFISAPLQPNQHGRLSALLVLPAAATDGATVLFLIPGGPARLNKGREVAITISGRGGIARLQPSAQAPYGAELSASEALRIAPEGGLVKVDVETSSMEMAPVSVKLRVGRKKS